MLCRTSRHLLFSQARWVIECDDSRLISVGAVVIAFQSNEDVHDRNLTLPQREESRLFHFCSKSTGCPIRSALQNGRDLAHYEGITHRRYRDPLAAFQIWYVQFYNAAPDAKLLTDEEVRNYRAFLAGVKGYKAATVNAYLAPLRAIVRDLPAVLSVAVQALP